MANLVESITPEVGGAFALGYVGSLSLYFLKGLYHTPRPQKIRGAWRLACEHAPTSGGE